MSQTQTILLLDAFVDSHGIQLYRVTTNENIVSFISVDAAKEYAGRVLTNGGDSALKPRKAKHWGGHGLDASLKKIEFALDNLAKTPMTVTDLYNLAQQSEDEEVKKAAHGTWGGLVSKLLKKRKVTVIGTRGHGAGVYKTIGR